MYHTTRLTLNASSLAAKNLTSRNALTDNNQYQIVYPAIGDVSNRNATDVDQRGFSINGCVTYAVSAYISVPKVHKALTGSRSYKFS